jgi:hypothetical protein
MTDQTTTPQAGSPDDFFDGVGGGGAPGFKFGGVNTGVKGTVLDQYRTFVTEPGSREPKKYPDGQPIPQLNVTLQTDLRNWDKVTKVPVDPETQQPLDPSEDDGKRRLFIKYDMRRAVAVAVKGVGERALAEGGVLAVKQSGEKATGKANPLPLFEARYEAPPKNADFLDGAEQDPWATTGEATTAPAAAAAPAADDEPPF